MNPISQYPTSQLTVKTINAAKNFVRGKSLNLPSLKVPTQSTAALTVDVLTKNFLYANYTFKFQIVKNIPVDSYISLEFPIEYNDFVAYPPECDNLPFSNLTG